MKKQYSWKIPGLSKGVDPAKAAEEISKIKGETGCVKPINIVDAARNPKSVLHKLFEWDDAKAAEHHRLQQARTILNNIQVNIIKDGEPRQISVYEVTTVEDKSITYKDISCFDKNDVKYIRSTIIASIRELKNKLSNYDGFDDLKKAIDKALKD